MKPLTSLPASARRALYDLVWAAGVSFAALAAYFKATEGGVPSWVSGGLAAVGVVGTATSFLARANTSDPVAEADPDSPTGAVSGPASPLPDGTPVDVEAAEDYQPEHRREDATVIHLDGNPS